MRNVKIEAALCVGLVVASGLGQTAAHAEVYKCPGVGGSLTLSNVEKGGNCTKMDLPPSPAPKKPATKVSSEAASKEVRSVKATEKPQSPYDTAAAERKRIIQEEMDLEKSRLNSVQARMRDLSANTAKTPDQVKELVALQQKESLHASNIQLLQKELNR
jgi:phage-related minor tail protein